MLAPTLTTSDGTELVVHDLGGSGDDLLLVHGASLCAEMMAPMAEVLAGAHHSIALDLRGHGSSARPVTRDFTWPRMGRDVFEVLEAAPAPLQAFGHSLGASTLLLAALERPDALRSLWLYEPIVLDSRYPGATEEMAQHAEGRRSVFASRAEIEAHFSGRGLFATFDPAVLAGYVDGGFRAQPNGSFALALDLADEAAIYRGSVAPGIWDGLDALPDLDLEITVLTGASSTGPTLVGAKRLAKLDPRVRVIEVPGLGHFGPFEAPRVVAGFVSAL